MGWGQHSESITRPKLNSIYEDPSKFISSESTVSESTSSKFSHTLTILSSDEIQYHGTDSGGDSENFSSSNREAMDGGEL